MPFGLIEALTYNSVSLKKYSLIRILRLKGIPKLMRMMKSMKVEGNTKKTEVLEAIQHLFNMSHT
jgi:hypothetical protein